MASSSDALYVTYGDQLADALQGVVDDDQLLVVREALRDGPLVPPPSEGIDAFVAMRAHHLAAAHAADESRAREELLAAWTRIAEHDGPVVLVVDEQTCIDCATFAACALDVLHRAGRGIAR
ncbi:MAG: hypothetical protein KDC46_11415, partial [Thermoleophilia bacterium]|nr:hypothetical protein [Thermoleophilia bacterium]